MIRQMTGGNVTEFDKITPQTYIDMNEEFEEEGTMVRIKVPTQEQLDKRTVEPRDMVQDMRDAYGGNPND